MYVGAVRIIGDVCRGRVSTVVVLYRSKRYSLTSLNYVIPEDKIQLLSTSGFSYRTCVYFHNSLFVLNSPRRLLAYLIPYDFEHVYIPRLYCRDNH